VVVVVAVVVLAAVLVGDLTTVARRRGGGASTPPVTVDAAARASIEAVVPELQRFVESARGLRFLTPVKVSILSGNAFDDALTEGDTDDPEADRVYDGLLRALGLVEGPPAPADPAGDAKGVSGFYDSDTKELVVRGTRPTPFVRQVLVHELTHALDDQHFGLDPDIADDDAGFAYDALAEGDAVTIEDRYVDSLSPEDRRSAREEEDALFGGSDDDADLLTELDDFPYVEGPHLVAALLAAGGQARLDAAFAAPPSSTAEALHPERYLAGRRRLPVAAPAAGGPVIDEGPLGELMLRLVLEESLGVREADRAAAGWAGDRYVAWRSGRRTCVRAEVVLDSPAEAAELASALRSWAADHPGVTVTPGASVGFSRCA
jgi:hypothetical protein